MQIAILSDSHGNHPMVEAVLRVLEERKINVVIHCGDIDDTETVWLFKGFTAHFVFGNCDWERTGLRQAIYGIGETLHENWGHLEIGGLHLAFTHGDDKQLLNDLEVSEAFDFVFYGHTHRAEEHRVGRTRVVNPGALQRANPKTFAILDLESQTLETVAME